MSTTNEIESPSSRGAHGDETLYELCHVERTFSKGGITVRAIRGIDLEIKRGETVALEGPSGSGKSTLLQLLGALDVPSSGSIRFAGRELAEQSDRVLTEIRRDEIGFVFQQFNLIPTLTAAENVAIAMAERGHKEQMVRTKELLSEVALEQRADHLPSRMSGGEQQRVAIARALANRPRVIIADEPTGNLDSETADEVMRVLLRLQESFEVTIVVATHDEQVAASMHRRVRLRDGLVVESLST